MCTTLFLLAHRYRCGDDTHSNSGCFDGEPNRDDDDDDDDKETTNNNKTKKCWLMEKKDGHNLFIFIFTPCIIVFDFASHSTLPFILNTLPKIKAKKNDKPHDTPSKKKSHHPPLIYLMTAAHRKQINLCHHKCCDTFRSMGRGGIISIKDYIS